MTRYGTPFGTDSFKIQSYQQCNMDVKSFPFGQSQLTLIINSQIELTTMSAPGGREGWMDGWMMSG